MIYHTFPMYHEEIRSVNVPVVVYGTRWCAMTQMIRRQLDRWGIPYKYVDLDLNPHAEAQLKWLTGGYVNHPTIYIGGRVLIEPSINELKWVLANEGYYY